MNPVMTITGGPASLRSDKSSARELLQLSRGVMRGLVWTGCFVAGFLQADNAPRYAMQTYHGMRHACRGRSAAFEPRREVAEGRLPRLACHATAAALI